MQQFNLGGSEHPVPVTIYETPEVLGQALAADLLSQIEAARVERRQFLLGCPGGRSLQTTYQALAYQAGQTEADLSHLVIVMMDDYVVPSADGFAHCPAEAHYSCRRFGREEIWAVINRALPPARRIPVQNLWFPNPADPARYDEKLAAAGGIDTFLLASGASDGHVAFNPPGSGLASRTRIIPLAETTRQDNLKTFPEFQDLAEVPAHGVSVGLGTIAELSRQVILVIHGAHKQEAVRRLAESTDFTPDWPATFIFHCRQPRVLLDKSASVFTAVDTEPTSH